MKNFAVIGKDVSQSSSPKMHSFIAERMQNQICYGARSIKESDFSAQASEMLNAHDGLNVTIPYKLSIMPYLDEVVGDALVFGAVNTVKRATQDGKTKYYGYNTDGLGFMLMLENAGVQTNGKTFLLLGAGGAGRSVAKKLVDAGSKVYVYDRNTENSTALSQEFDGVEKVDDLQSFSTKIYAIINATGVGMHKSVGLSPVGEEIISLCDVAIDLIYVPEKSRFLELAESLGKQILNGKAMLFYQAYYAECIFFDVDANSAQAKRIFEEYLREE